MDSQSVQILLVEDSAGDARLIKEVFSESKLHNKIHHVEDGEEAIFFLKKLGKYADAETPDLILLDLNLPKKDGREVLTEIKADAKLVHIPVVILTTSRSEEDIVRSYNLHANCYIQKPMEFDHFVKVIQTIENFWFTVVKLPTGKV